jgi:hypothetical protein
MCYCSASSDDALLSPTNEGKAECAGAGDTATKNETGSSHGTTPENKVGQAALLCHMCRGFSPSGMWLLVG